ncbi:aldehyde-activating protein [Roseobacter cerasinus]|uniref:Aldehyde-activating protein n=1 Tax=Roseobacter cerasinus TaxID=2602289 RepID=A0A640VUF3_9RHOB|nr:aldehyde-activating protein [Roseobacter cerasinus]
MTKAVHSIKGRCLCGAVTLTVQSVNPRLRACHCDMCRRHTSGMFISVDTLPGTLEVSGPAQSFASSEWAERGFCGTCGSTLWYGTVHDGMRHPAAGLFDAADLGEMTLEFFVDECPQGYALSGDHRKLSTEETIAMFEGDA